MADVPSHGEYETATDWLEAVADETDTDLEVLEGVVTQIESENGSPSDDRKARLRRLLEEHTDFMTEVEGDANAWIDIYFERDGEVDSYYQYSMMNHNLARVKPEEVEAMEKVAEEEDMDLEVRIEDGFVMGTQLDWNGVNEELRLVLKVLEEVYDVGLEDVKSAEEQREGEIITWTGV